MLDKYRYRVSVLVLVFISWMIIQAVRSFVNTEPYPAVFYPGFSSRGDKPIMQRKLYKVANSETELITYRASSFGHYRFRKLLGQICTAYQMDDSAGLEKYTSGLIDIKNLERGDTILIQESKWIPNNGEYTQSEATQYQLIL